MKNNKAKPPVTVGVVGVRGYVGRELIPLIERHPMLSLQWVSSRQLDGNPLNKLAETSIELTIKNFSPERVAEQDTQIIILALPNGIAKQFVDALQKAKKNTPQVIIDLSADYRFDAEWQYSVPEIGSWQHQSVDSRPSCRISNPGCYATAMQLLIAPIIDKIEGSPHCFGISGYSGAGTVPTKFNDPELLNDNILAYKVIEHLHEEEVSFQLSHAVSFTPHVAQFFRGIVMTVQVHLKQSLEPTQLKKYFEDYYSAQSLVDVQTEIPHLHQVIGSYKAVIGGLAVSKCGRRATLVCCIDNLLKGAASQAIQNINIALGFSSELGLIKRESADANSSKNKQKELAGA